MSEAVHAEVARKVAHQWTAMYCRARNVSADALVGVAYLAVRRRADGRAARGLPAMTARQLWLAGWSGIIDHLRAGGDGLGATRRAGLRVVTFEDVDFDRLNQGPAPLPPFDPVDPASEREAPADPVYDGRERLRRLFEDYLREQPRRLRGSRRAVVRAVLVDGLTVAEVARREGRSVPTVRRQLLRAGCGTRTLWSGGEDS